MCSEPCMVTDSRPRPNSTPRAPGIAINPRASAGSNPSNQGSPTPKGKLETRASTVDPILSPSFRSDLTRLSMDSAASTSLQFKIVQASPSGSRSNSADIEPIWLQCASTVTSPNASRTIEPAATSPRVSRPEWVPPPRGSAAPPVRVASGKSACPGRG